MMAVGRGCIAASYRLLAQVGAPLRLWGDRGWEEQWPGSTSSWPYTFLSWEQTSTAGHSLGTPPCTWLLAWARPPSPNCSLKLVRHCLSSFLPMALAACAGWCQAQGQTHGPASCHPFLTGADVLCENDEPMSLSSSEASSDTDTDPEEQEVAMDLGEPAPAAEHSTNSKLSTQGQWQAGHRQRRCHTSLDLTRSQKVRAVLQWDKLAGSVPVQAMACMGHSSRR